MRSRPSHAVVPALAAALAAGALGYAAPPEDAVAARGARFYRDGLSGAGSDVPAIVQGDLRVRSTDMTCIHCHRRSGWGAAEGPVRVPPIVGSVLFAPVTRGTREMGPLRTTGLGTRPAYTVTTLLRALRDGVDPAGRALSPSMPRYALGGEDAAALAAHLRALSAAPAPGVDDSTVHLATIVTPGVSDVRRASMLQVLRAYVRDRNAGTRNETGRRQRGPWDMKQHYEVYRNWALHEWEMRGSPREWPAQIEELYRKQPVFAIVSGLGEGDWAPIHEVAERLNLPVVLPQTPLPPDADSGDPFYSLYFSRGVTLEAETVARHLAAPGRPARVLQVSRCGSAGEMAAAVMARSSTPTVSVRTRCLDRAAVLDRAAWRELLQGGEDALVSWLGSDDAPALEALAADQAALAAVREIYLSSSLLGEEWRRLPAALAGRGRLLHPFVPPDAFPQHAWRSLAWMKANRIEPADRVVAVNALFAATLVADALSHPRTLVSREYFLERMEHMASRSPNRSAYPAVSFGPDRRFGSSACQVLKVPEAAGEPLKEVAAWHVPRP